MFSKVIFYVMFAVNAATLAALAVVLFQDHFHPYLPMRDEARLVAFCLAAWTSITWALHSGGRHLAAAGMAAVGAIAIASAAAGGWSLR